MVGLVVTVPKYDRLSKTNICKPFDLVGHDVR